MAKPKHLSSNRAVGRLVIIGHSLYVTVPASIRDLAGLKQGDRVVMETDGRTVLFAKIPFEELINRALLKRKVKEDQARGAE